MGNAVADIHMVNRKDFFHILLAGTCTKRGSLSSFSVKSVNIKHTMGKLERNITPFADVGRFFVRDLSLTLFLCFSSNSLF